MKWFFIGLVICAIGLKLLGDSGNRYYRKTAKTIPSWRRSMKFWAGLSLFTGGIIMILYWVYLISGAMDRLMGIPG